jgi:hypothetical protein
MESDNHKHSVPSILPNAYAKSAQTTVKSEKIKINVKNTNNLVKHCFILVSGFEHNSNSVPLSISVL